VLFDLRRLGATRAFWVNRRARAWTPTARCERGSSATRGTDPPFDDHEGARSFG